MPTKKLAALSPSETEILRLVWQLGRGTVQDICERLPQRRRVAYATVQTLLRRLEGKGYLVHETQGKAHVFLPAVARADVVSRTVGDFVERLFGGDPRQLMLHLADSSGLKPKDVERLKKLLDAEEE